MSHGNYYPPPPPKVVHDDSRSFSGLVNWLKRCWTNWRAIVVYTATHDVANITANNTNAEDITVTGVEVGDEVLACYADVSGPQDFIIHNARVTAADTVRVWVTTPAGGGYNPASQSYKFVVLKFRNVGG